jgi:DNA-binding GntR family transcriptional regulator
LSSIVRTTLAEQAYRDLRERIVSGRLSAGHRLLPDELALALSISATPIKEALVRLEQDGLVATETRRGAVVRRFAPDEVVDLYEARAMIELHALARGCAEGRANAAFAEQLQAIQTRLLAHRAKKSMEGLVEALASDRAFHGLIVTLAGNRTMAEWHIRVLMQTHTVRNYSLASYAPRRLADEHAAIIAAIQNGDARTAHAALERHLRLSRDEIMSRNTPETAGAPR